eukprot:scaffold195666_cov33-Tisochrysis_lutea.AAC.2
MTRPPSRAPQVRGRESSSRRLEGEPPPRQESVLAARGSPQYPYRSPHQRRWHRNQPSRQARWLTESVATLRRSLSISPHRDCGRPALPARARRTRAGNSGCTSFGNRSTSSGTPERKHCIEGGRVTTRTEPGRICLCAPGSRKARAEVDNQQRVTTQPRGCQRPKPPFSRAHVDATTTLEEGLKVAQVRAAFPFGAIGRVAKLLAFGGCKEGDLLWPRCERREKRRAKLIGDSPVGGEHLRSSHVGGRPMVEQYVEDISHAKGANEVAKTLELGDREHSHTCARL